MEEIKKSMNGKIKHSMKLFDIYKSKTTGEIIKIDSFATRMDTHSEMIIIFRKMFKLDGEYGYAPSSNGYGTVEEIEKEYEFVRGGLN